MPGRLQIHDYSEHTSLRLIPAKHAKAGLQLSVNTRGDPRRGGEPTRQKLRRHPSLPIATLRNYLRAICHPRRLVHASSEIAFRERVKISDLGHRTHDLAVTPPVQSTSPLLRGATCLLTCGWAESTPRRPPRDAQLLALLPSVMASLSVGRTWDLLLTSRRWRR